VIAADCIPANESETVIEILDTYPTPNPNRFGQYTFFTYWIGTGHFTGVRGQIFVKHPDEFDEHQKNARVVDRRYKPKERIK
jgi:hypothetical protein